MLGTPEGKRRPRGALLQPIVGAWLRVQSVGGSLRGQVFGLGGGANVTPPSCDCVSNRFGGTAIGGQFRWGGSLSKKYREGPKVGLGGSEIRRQGQDQKPA